MPVINFQAQKAIKAKAEAMAEHDCCTLSAFMRRLIVEEENRRVEQRNRAWAPHQVASGIPGR